MTHMHGPKCRSPRARVPEYAPCRVRAYVPVLPVRVRTNICMYIVRLSLHSIPSKMMLLRIRLAIKMPRETPGMSAYLVKYDNKLPLPCRPALP